MGFRVELARAAERDRDGVVEYLLKGTASKASAVAFLDGLETVLGHLKDYPLMYPLSQEPRLARMGYRKALFGNYLALYRLEGERVIVARIFHQRRDYAKLV